MKGKKLQKIVLVIIGIFVILSMVLWTLGSGFY